MTDRDASNQIIRDQAEQTAQLRAELEAARAASAASQTPEPPRETAAVPARAPELPPGSSSVPAPLPPSPGWRDDPWLRHMPLVAGLLVAALVAGLIVLLTGSLF